MVLQEKTSINFYYEEERSLKIAGMISEKYEKLQMNVYGDRGVLDLFTVLLHCGNKWLY